MAGLKELRNRIKAIKSTQKITSAMKMVAAARLRRAQMLLHDSSIYNELILNSVKRVLLEFNLIDSTAFFPVISTTRPKGVEEKYCKNEHSVCQRFLLHSADASSRRNDSCLLIIFSSDRGLCGSFNMNIARDASARIIELQKQGKEVKLICIGKKAGDILKRKFAANIIETIEDASFDSMPAIASRILEMQEIDTCEIIYSKFESTINRTTKTEQILPITLPLDGGGQGGGEETHPNSLNMSGNAFYEYEPSPQKMLEELFGQLFRMFLFRALANSQASEYSARMVSMDNATRNARDIISKLTLKYNGMRQSAITNELIEIISGAEAV